MQIKAAIFDMDGTLVDSLMLWDMLWAELGQKYLDDENFKPGSEDDKKVRTLTLKDAMELIHKNYNMGKDGAELLTIANDGMVQFYKNEVELKPGVREFLEHLKNNGTKMCIATATAMDLVGLALEHCDIAHYFSNVFSCGTLGKGKDEPDVFLLARDFLGEETKDTWVFEDSLTAIKTAKKIGLSTVGIYDYYNYGQEEIEKLANIYVAENETFLKLI